MKQLFPFAFSILIVLTSCDRGLMNRQRVKEDISIKGLLDSLHLKVASRNPLLIKSATVDGLVDSAQMTLDSGGWNREFQIFNDLKISPGRLEGRYIKKVTKDSLTHFSFIGKDPQNLQLDSFRVSLDQEDELSSIRAFVNYANSLNTTQQTLEMEFNTLNNELLPLRYATKGWQKMRLKDTVHFTIHANLDY